MLDMACAAVDERGYNDKHNTNRNLILPFYHSSNAILHGGKCVKTKKTPSTINLYLTPAQRASSR